MERGSATIETALVLPLLLTVALALVQLFAVGALHLRLVSAAREGARTAATRPDPADAVATVRATLGEPLASQARVRVERSSRAGSQAEVRVTVDRPLVGPLFDRIRIPVHGRAVMLVEP